MRIAIDARELVGKRTGVGRYLSELLAVWDTLPSGRGHTFIPLQPGRGEGGTLWEQLTLPRLLRQAEADVLFAPGYTGPLRSPMPMVLAIHDVSFAAHPEWFSWREGARRRTLTRLAGERAERVVTISQFSRGEIGRHLGLPLSRIDVIYPGVTQVARSRAPAAEHSTHTILYVGSLFNRRHIAEMITGFARLARGHDVRLEIVGDNRTRPAIDAGRLASSLGAGGTIGLRSYVPDEQLAALYAGARAFVFLSAYEGFGLTPLEALASGVPPVVLDTPVAREVCGDAAFYVSSADPAAIESALERAVFDEAARAAVLTAAPAVLARYSWQRCAEQVLDVLVSAGSR